MASWTLRQSSRREVQCRCNCNFRKCRGKGPQSRLRRLASCAERGWKFQYPCVNDKKLPRCLSHRGACRKSASTISVIMSWRYAITIHRTPEATVDLPMATCHPCRRLVISFYFIVNVNGQFVLYKSCKYIYTDKNRGVMSSLNF